MPVSVVRTESAKSKSILALSVHIACAAAILLLTQFASEPAQADKVTGPNACAECHKEEAEVWKKTHHFSTFTKMPRSKEARKIADKMKIKRVKSQSLCLGCHFTTQTKGKKKKPIAGISCESCHAAGDKWLKQHSEFSGKTEKTESKAEAAVRRKQSDKLGMIRPGGIYKLAKNCFGCHVVPREKLVNVGGHPAGSPFELVSWSQGEVRHNLWYTKGKSNPEANAARRRILYITGLTVELETALRAVGEATVRKTYAFRMARRADAARKKLEQVAKAVPSAPELSEIVQLSHSAGLKLNNKAALNGAADKIALKALVIIGKYKGNELAGADSLIPRSDKYKGKPAK